MESLVGVFALCVSQVPCPRRAAVILSISPQRMLPNGSQGEILPNACTCKAWYEPKRPVVSENPCYKFLYWNSFPCGEGSTMCTITAN